MIHYNNRFQDIYQNESNYVYVQDIHVLDAGCGTGNYALEFIQHGVGHVTLLDASPGMLEKAKSKLSEHIASGKVTDVIEAMIPMLPFPDGSFDAIMYNLVSIT